MTRLSGYVLGLYVTGALAFFAIAGFLIYVVQTLRLFDLVTAKGQDVLTLLGQSALITPSFALQILYICMAVGALRALRGLQASRELHTIHSSGRVRSIWIAGLVFVAGGIGIVSALAHWVEPAANRVYEQWSAEVTADLVGRSLNPHRFSEVVPGLIIVIGGRDSDGTVRDFFADDRRNPGSQRTYVAKRAQIVSGEDGYNLGLYDGAIQYQRPDEQFTEVNFASYELALERLVDNASGEAQLAQKSTPQILIETNGLQGLSTGGLYLISQRFAEATRLAALCLLAFCLAAFPSGRRITGRAPLEIVIVVVALIDRGLGGLLLPGHPFGPHFGAVLMTGTALIILFLQLYGGRLPRFRRGFA